MSSKLGERFAALFRGLERAFGTFVTEGSAEKGSKVKGTARTVTDRPVVQKLYDQHLAGVASLGIVPLREDGTVLFVALDIDKYSVDLARMARYLARKKFPAVVCRSKSGGAHVYIFFLEPAPMAKVRPSLKKFATHLGFPKCEIFPKQNKLGPGDTGNWINLPYFDAERTTRYALGPDGQALTFQEFIACAELRRTTVEALRDVELEDLRFRHAPPCLRALTAQGKFPEGSRNNGLFDLAVFAKRRYEGNDEMIAEAVREWNREFMTPGTEREVQGVLRSLDRKAYEYRCSEEPIVSVCDKDACRKSRYCPTGFRAEQKASDVGVQVERVTMIQSDPPLWILEIAGEKGTTELRLETQELMRQELFRQRCLERLFYLPHAVKKKAWDDWINEISEGAERVEAPADAGAEGTFWSHFERFLLDRPRARNRDELLAGKPWVDENERIHFRAQDLFRYLQQQRFTVFKEHQVYGILKRANSLDKHFYNLKGRGVNCWSVPLPREQDEPHEVPKTESKSDF